MSNSSFWIEEFVASFWDNFLRGNFEIDSEGTKISWPEIEGNFWVYSKFYDGSRSTVELQSIFEGVMDSGRFFSSNYWLVFLNLFFIFIVRLKKN